MLPLLIQIMGGKNSTNQDMISSLLQGMGSNNMPDMSTLFSAQNNGENNNLMNMLMPLLIKNLSTKLTEKKDNKIYEEYYPNIYPEDTTANSLQKNENIKEEFNKVIDADICDVNKELYYLIQERKDFT